MTLQDQARAFARRYPTPASHPNGGDGSWDQDCGRFCFRFADWLGWRTWPRGDVSSAYRVAMASGPLNGDPAAAGRHMRQTGRMVWHFWDIAGPDNGHVAAGVDENTLVAMGSAGVWEDLGADIGFSSVAAYGEYRPHARYLGWADNYAGGTVDVSRFFPTSAPAGMGSTPVTPAQLVEDTLMAGRQYYARVRPDGTDDGEWMLAGVDVFPEPGNDPAVTRVWYRDGYAVTTDKAVAIRWARQYGIGPNERRAVRLEREPYVAQQQHAEADARAWRAGLGRLIAAAVAGVDLDALKPAEREPVVLEHELEPPAA